MEDITKTSEGEDLPAENKMGVMPINRLILTMSLPMMASMLVQALYNIVDSIFVAQVSENALTAVSLAFPMQSLMIAVATGTGVGVNALLSKRLGMKDYEGVNRVANNGIYLMSTDQPKSIAHFTFSSICGIINARKTTRIKQKACTWREQECIDTAMGRSVCQIFISQWVCSCGKTTAG